MSGSNELSREILYNISYKVKRIGNTAPKKQPFLQHRYGWQKIWFFFWVLSSLLPARGANCNQKIKLYGYEVPLKTWKIQFNRRGVEWTSIRFFDRTARWSSNTSSLKNTEVFLSNLSHLSLCALFDLLHLSSRTCSFEGMTFPFIVRLFSCFFVPTHLLWSLIDHTSFCFILPDIKFIDIPWKSIHSEIWFVCHVVTETRGLR